MYNRFESEVQQKVDCTLPEPHNHWGNRQINHKIKKRFPRIFKAGTPHIKSLKCLSLRYIWLNDFRTSFLKVSTVALMHTHTHTHSVSRPCSCQPSRVQKESSLPSRSFLPPHLPLCSANLFSFWVNIHSAYNQREKPNKETELNQQSPHWNCKDCVLEQNAKVGIGSEGILSKTKVRRVQGRSQFTSVFFFFSEVGVNLNQTVFSFSMLKRVLNLELKWKFASEGGG